MAHNARLRLDPAWATGTLWTAANESALDAALLAAVNGDGGGTWSPTSNIVIQGAGVRLIGNVAPHVLSGAHSAITTDGATTFLTHGDSDYCVLGPGHTGATVSLRSPVSNAVSPAGWTTFGPLGPFSIFALALGVTARVPLRVHNGALFKSATFAFTVSAGATAIPAQLPRFGVFARDAFGSVTTLLAYQTIPAPANAGAWSNSGLPQSVTYTIATPVTLIDTSRYSYFAEIAEVSGAGAAVSAVAYGDPLLTFSSVLDIRPR